MNRFLLVCLAQVVSLMGSELTAFGLGIWAYQKTGITAVYGWVALATLGPGILATPLAGVLVDRWSPRVGMLVGHAGAGVCTLVIVLLVRLDALEVGPILLLVALASTFNALQMPGLTAATAQLVPADKLSRANGVAQLGMAVVQVLAPAFAGMLLTRVGLWSILSLDVLTFMAAIALLLRVRLGPGSVGRRTAVGARNLLGAGLEGLRYVLAHPGLIGLMVILAVVNFNLAMVQVLLVPLVLRFSDVQSLGLVLSIGGVGMLAGSGLLTGWGGPRHRILGVLGSILLQGLLYLLGGLRPSVPLVAAGAFGVMFFVPFIFGSSQALLQGLVPTTLLGRISSIRFMLAQATIPFAFLVAGPLADGVFEPLMSEQGPLAGSLGAVLGVGPGRGIGLLLMMLGLLSVMTAIAGLMAAGLRQLEADAARQPVKK